MHMRLRSISAISIFFLSLPAIADGVFLKSGEIIQGQILKLEKKTIKIKDTNGKTRHVDRKNELRFFMGSLDLKEKFIYLNNDKLIVGYIVAEDKLAYVVRKKLSSPKEEAIIKTEIKTISARKIEEKTTRLGGLYRSLLIPGWGQGYYGHKTKAWTMLGINLALIGGGTFLAIDRSNKIATYNELTSTATEAEFSNASEKADNANRNFNIFAIAAATYYTLNLADVWFFKGSTGFLGLWGQSQKGGTTFHFSLRVKQF